MRALAVEALDGPVIRQWIVAGGVLDSAFGTAGGRDQWTYHGLTARPDGAAMPSTVAV